MRGLLFVHRWLGIAVGWLVALWCLSGVVMMYGGYPSLSAAEHYAGLAPLDLACCASLPGTTSTRSCLSTGSRSRCASPRRGSRSTCHGVTPTSMLRAAASSIRPSRRTLQRSRVPMRAAPASRRTLRQRGEIESDQWTLSGAYSDHRPMFRFEVDDPSHTELYVSSASGEIVLRTSRAERLWGWLGPVLHWLYPRRLRENTALWVDVIIATTVIGTFLTALGLYIGIQRLRRRHDGRWSPYRGVSLWHHYAGLVFGLLTLTWTLSGLLSVNPWGLLESVSAAAAAQRVAGAPLTVGAVVAHIEALAAHGLPAGTVSLRGRPLDGRLYDIAYDAEARSRRLDGSTLAPTALGKADIEAAAQRLAAGASLRSVERLERGDAYYFSQRDSRPLPVYRVLVDDAERTRYYLDAASGDLVQQYDRARRGYRWLFEGLHRLDFSAQLRRRPVWDILMLLLLGGVCAVSLTGTYLGLRHLLR